MNGLREMTMLRHRARFRTVAIAVTCLLIGVELLSAQQGSPAPQPMPQGLPGRSTAIPTYRAPTIVLAQPTEGATLPHDKPVVLFRFTHGEPNDPIDLATFAVAVDGIDRTSLFQITAGDAWGPLALPSAPNDSGLAVGVHQLAARVCSARGACAFTAASITVVPSTPALQPSSQPAAAGIAADSSRNSASSRRRRVIDAVLTAVRKLLSP